MRVIVGRVGRAHGIRGEVIVGVRTDEPDARFAVGATVAAEGHGTLTVARSRWHGGQLLVAFSGIDDRTKASKLAGAWLSVDTADLPPTGDPDEFRDHELIGLTVRTVAGETVGDVRDVLHYGQDLLQVRLNDNNEDRLIPFVKALVPVVDVAAGVLVVDPPPGLLDPDEAESDRDERERSR